MFRKGKIFSSPFFSAKVLPIFSGKTKFLFIVSLKVSKKSTERNKIKRRARAIVSKNIPAIREGYAVFIFFKKEALRLSFENLEKEIFFLLSQAKVVSSK